MIHTRKELFLFVFLILFSIITLHHNLNSNTQFNDAKYENNVMPIYVNPEDGTGGDAGDSFQDAMLVNEGTILGSFESGDEDDYYTFTAFNGDAVKINLTADSLTDFDLMLYEPSTDQRSSSMRPDSIEFIISNIDKTGDWYVRVRRYSGYGNYTLTLDLFDTFATPQTTTSELSNGLTKFIWIIATIIPLIFIGAIIVFMRRKKQEERETTPISYTQDEPEIDDITILEEPEIKSDDTKEDIYRGYSFGLDEEEI